MTFVPAVLIGAGLLAFHDRGVSRQDVRDFREENFAGFSTGVDDFTRFAPALAVYGLNLGGVPGRHTVGRATISFAVGSAIYLPVVFLIKTATNASSTKVKPELGRNLGCNALPFWRRG